MATTLESGDGVEALLNGSPAESNGKPHVIPSQAALQPDFWSASAPRRLRRGSPSADEAWRAYWKKSESRESVAALCRSRKSPLRWALDDDSWPADAVEILKLADEYAGKPGRRATSLGKNPPSLAATLSDWLTGARDADMGLEFAISCLAAAEVLGAAGGLIDAPLGWEIINFLVKVVHQAQAWQPDAELPPEAVVVEQLLAGELPLVLSYLLSEMVPVGALGDGARRRLSRGLVELLNGRGLPGGANIGVLRLLTACWTRCRAIGTQAGVPCWSPEAEAQYRWLVRQSIRLTAADGAPLLGDKGTPPWSRNFLATALRLGGRKKDRAAAQAMLRPSTDRATDAKERKLLAPAEESEWSSLAVMRTGWSPDAAVTAIDYSAPDMRIDVWAGRRQLFVGACATESQADGKTLEPTGGWEQLCWFSDKDCDYLELRMELTGGAWLERQILLARRDRFLLLADHLQNPQVGALGHQIRVPLAPGVAYDGEAETRDGFLSDGKPLARVLPLALPEWRIDPRVGELAAADHCLELVQQATARAMACPLFIDLDARRAKRPSTWRQLTIAEWLHIQPADVAVGYRIQCGKAQWVYYRSLAARGNRTLLGQNTSSEFLMARFLPSTGLSKELIEIEG